MICGGYGVIHRISPTSDSGIILQEANHKLKIKLAGGAAAQCLALMNAIYLRNKLQRNFELFYFPHSTGTFWPFAIEFLLNDDELASSNVGIKGLEEIENLEVGKIIKSHPLAARRFSYEKVLSVIRRLKLERYLQKLRGEDALLASRKNLDKVTSKAKAVSGGFVPTPPYIIVFIGHHYNQKIQT